MDAVDFVSIHMRRGIKQGCASGHIHDPGGAYAREWRHANRECHGNRSIGSHRRNTIRFGGAVQHRAFRWSHADHHADILRSSPFTLRMRHQSISSQLKIASQPVSEPRYWFRSEQVLTILNECEIAESLIDVDY